MLAVGNRQAFNLAGLTVWKKFSRKGCVIGVYYHNSLMVGNSAKRHLPWIDDMGR